MSRKSRKPAAKTPAPGKSGQLDERQLDQATGGGGASAPHTGPAPPAP